MLLLQGSKQWWANSLSVAGHAKGQMAHHCIALQETLVIRSRGSQKSKLPFDFPACVIQVYTYP